MRSSLTHFPILQTATAAAILLLGVSWSAGHPARAAVQPISIGTLVQQQTDLSRLPLLHDWSSHLQSSYDRSGGNDDSGKFLTGDTKEGVMADMDGPGAIVRIWSANPGGQIKIYIDGSPTPVIDTPFHKLFDGSMVPFKGALSGPSSGGVYTYVPIPYAHHCRVVLENGKGVYYHVNYLTFAPGTEVHSFSLPLDPADLAAVDAAHADWWSGPPSAETAAPARGKPVTVSPGGTITLGNYTGASVIRQVTLTAPNATDADLRLLVLRATFDDHHTFDIQAPLADFFGNAFGRKPFHTLLLSCSSNGVMQANFPMPFSRMAHFTLENGGSHSINLTWNVTVDRQPFKPAEDGYFHAIWTQEITERGRPHVWAHATDQRGRYVGVVQTMQSHGGIGYLEGDDQFRVDDQTWLPSRVSTTVVGPWNGTGTEDCFNSGWYFDKGPNSLPVNALIVKDEYQGDINCMRFFLADAPTFQKSLDGQIEHGGANDASGVYYSSVAYWYSNGPVQPWFKMPPASTLALPKPLPPPFILAHAIEGESLVGSAKASGGHVSPQGMQGFGSGWSHSNQLWWTDGKTGDTLTLTFTPKAPGTYDLAAYFTKANDYGQVSFQLNGAPLAATLDAYAPTVVPSGPVDLGTATLPAGPSTLVITITGKNAQARNFLFGLDALALNAPGSKPVPLPAPPQP